MFSWIKSLFSSKTPEVKDEVVKSDPFPFPTSETATEKAWPAPVEKTQETVQKASSKKSPKAKKPKVDFSTMNKKQLLDLCKERGIKANASLKREELVERLQK